jgi:NAD(P)-dependent dehydrogenase (short-subunit alcohol dehydrogenase family)
VPERSLEGLTALIVGGSSGIGLAIAEGFQAAGARVAIAARTPDKLARAAEALQAADPQAQGYAVDMNHRAAIEGLAADVAQDLGPLDVLVNCQGTTVIKPSLEVSEDEFDLVMDTNLKSVYFACTILGRAMLARGQGAIINIASLAGHRGWPRACAYAMSKHGVLGLTRTLGAEWAAQGVRVNSISPGFFMTELNRARMPEARKQAALARTPYARFGALEELVGAAVYLASPAAGFVTGTDIAVDGGYLAAGI